MGNGIMKFVYEKGAPLDEVVKSALQDTADCPELSVDFVARVEAMVGRTQSVQHGRAFKIAASIAACVTVAGLVFAAVVGGRWSSTAASDSVGGNDPVRSPAADEPLQVEDVVGWDAYQRILAEDADCISASASISSSNEKENQNVNTRRKMTAAFAAAALVAASPNLARTANGEPYTSASYVQNGLIAQWDGIDNVGTGTHNPAAAVWKDLKGSCDMTLLNNGESWVNGKALYVNGAGAAGSTAAPRYTTIEVVYKMLSGACLFTSGLKWGDTAWYLSRIVAFSGGKYAVFVNAHDGNPIGKTIYVSDAYDSSSVHSLFAVYADNNSDSVVEAGRDGIVSSTWSTTTSWYDATGVVMVGDRKTNARSEPWSGEIYAIRLYNRALTYRELATNHAVDEARFGVSGWYSYISSGDPVAAATANSCTMAEVTPSAAIEARYSTLDWSDGIALDATELHLGTMFSIR